MADLILLLVIMFILACTVAGFIILWRTLSEVERWLGGHEDDDAV